MHEKLSKNSQSFVVNFVAENFELFFDSYGAQIQTEARSILVSRTMEL